MPAQSSVPPTAVQAAKMPQYASRLARAGSRPAPRKIPTLARRGFQGPIIYDNGPINGRTDAWVFNSGFVVSNTFTITGGGPVAGMSFGAWLEPGDTLQSAEVSITSSEFGGTSFFDQSVNFTQSGCVTNQDGFNVCTETAIFSGPFLNAGTYWLNLNNAVTSLGAPVYWDENSGAGCQSPGCPSLASSNQVGTIPSESFSMLGECTAEDKPPTGAKIVTVPPSPTLPYRVIYNFTGAADGGFPATGLVIDPAGNLYGTTGFGGSSGSGTTFKLSPSASGWRFTRLNSFSSANGFSPESTPVLDADGRLFGTAAGGGAHDFGVLFSLSPPGHILPSVFSNWMETLLYSFADGNDGAVPDGSLVLDSSGNIYGTASTHGANGGGTLYEFTNSGIQIQHAFPAFNGDGITPIGVVNGSDGLYGITTEGGSNLSGTLYTTAGGYQILHSFEPDVSEGNPISLAADQVGNLYGTSSFSGSCGGGSSTVFQLSPPDWNPVTLTSSFQFSSWVSTDAAGNVYGTTDFGGLNFQGNVFKLTCCWNYTDMHDFSGGPNDGDQPLASPVVDAHGNIYGTTVNGGTHGFGTVWEISP